MLEYLRTCHRLSTVLAAAMLWLTIAPSVHASIISNEQLVMEQQSNFERSNLVAAFQRDDVKQVLISKGVDPQKAIERVSSMTDSEVAELNQKIDELPAGSGVLELAVFVFLVLVVTDLLGVTDVFPFVDKAN